MARRSSPPSSPARLVARIDHVEHSYYISENPSHASPVGDEAIIDIVGYIEEISPTYRQHLHQPIDISLVCSKSFERDGRTPTTDNPFLLPIRLRRNDRGLMAYLPADMFWALPLMIEAGRYTHVEARFNPLHRGRGDLVSLFFGTSSRIDDMNRPFAS